MKTFVKEDEWKIVEDNFCKDNMRSSESLFSIANGEFGIRASFEETYSGDSLKGCYIAGVYYPDKTKVGWWKIGYPDNFNKSPNSAYWSGVKLWIDDQEIDLNTAEIYSYHRELNMRKGLLRRKVGIVTANGKRVILESQRICSIEDKRLGVLMYSVRAVDYDVDIKITSYIDADVQNEGANYDEKFWTPISYSDDAITLQTKKSDFRVCWAMCNNINRGKLTEKVSSDKYIAETYKANVSVGDIFVLNKFVAITSSVNYKLDTLEPMAIECIEKWSVHSSDYAFEQHAMQWKKRWEMCDIEISSDIKAQQGVRFGIFNLLQTYDGTNPVMNIAPKGFSGEKYAGGTYWDTEAYLMPFYTFITGPDVAKNLLLYRYNQLDKAVENAEKIGFTDGAALYPMVTFNGEECHNEWEVTFEEIHRNGAIAYAIGEYVKNTGDTMYLATNGVEVLVALARFWAQRVNFSNDKNKYVILGVTGPNEYENNVNNNWHTNYIAAWSLRYACQAINIVSQLHPDKYDIVKQKCSIDNDKTRQWQYIADNMYLPFNADNSIILQQDGFMDKDILPVDNIPIEERPINQHWSWDRILRSCYIKQADVLQCLFFFEDDFSEDTIRHNYDFYEPITVHESSLSASVHSTLASSISNKKAAYDMFMRVARLDIDDYNYELQEGLHITSMGGTWFSVVRGFAGMKVRDGKLTFANRLPEHWDSLKFKVVFNGEIISVLINKEGVSVA